MAKGKWISELHPKMNRTTAARKVLKTRLAVVNEMIPRVLQEAQSDPEHVHQLRVSTRRADAALRIFENLIHRKVFQKARKTLRKLRRAAGDARDWDVFLTALKERRASRPAEEHPGLDFLAGHALHQRQLAQPGLENVGRKVGALDDLTECVLDSLASSGKEKTFGELAREVLARREKKLRQKAEGAQEDPDQMHSARIACKRLRYALEIFIDCLPSSARETLYPQVEALQDILGRANDSHLAIAFLSSTLEHIEHTNPGPAEEVKVGIQELLRFHQERIPQEREHFLRWWEHWQLEGSPCLREALEQQQTASC